MIFIRDVSRETSQGILEKAGVQTIYALSSGIGRVAVAVIRVTGPSSCEVLLRLTGTIPESRKATLKSIVDPSTGELIDRSIVLWFPGPGSFTGEDSVEFQVHGGRAVIEALFRVLRRLGCRPADPGEFTRRAFANGKISLTEIEGLADLIDAETDQQRQLALRLSTGVLQSHVLSWRSEIISMLATIESNIDFAEEGDVPELVLGHIIARASDLRGAFQSCISNGLQGKRLRDGFKVVITGPPNAGKSTLLNSLAKRDVAIVSNIPGTTRDILEVNVDLRGLPVTFVDTAGLRKSMDPIEIEGIRRANEQIRNADLVLSLWPFDSDDRATLTEYEREKILVVRTKSDLTGDVDDDQLAVSAPNGHGIDDLLEKIFEVAKKALETQEPPLMNRDRHLDSLQRASSYLSEFSPDTKLPIEIMSDHLMCVARELGSLIGLVDVEDVLDDLFGRFCIGK